MNIAVTTIIKRITIAAATAVAVTAMLLEVFDSIG